MPLNYTPNAVVELLPHRGKYVCQDHGVRSVPLNKPPPFGIGFTVRADFRRLYPANAKTPTCCPSDDNRTKVTNSVTSARSLWWHVGPYFWPADLTRMANPIAGCLWNLPLDGWICPAEMSSLHLFYLFIKFDLSQQLHPMQDAGLVELAVNAEVFLQISLCQSIEHPAVHQVLFKCITVLRKAKVMDPAVSDPRMVNQLGFWVWPKKRHPHSFSHLLGVVLEAYGCSSTPFPDNVGCLSTCLTQWLDSGVPLVPVAASSCAVDCWGRVLSSAPSHSILTTPEKDSHNGVKWWPMATAEQTVTNPSQFSQYRGLP